MPADRVRLHVCWGNYEGPHHRDIPLAKVLPVLLRVKPMALLIEGAIPRHEHEWEIWKNQPLPADKILVPGVLDSSCNFIEHPELVAQRIVRDADLVGRDRVIAGTDCGFGTFAGFGAVHPAIGWGEDAVAGRRREACHREAVGSGGSRRVTVRCRSTVAGPAGCATR